MKYVSGSKHDRNSSSARKSSTSRSRRKRKRKSSKQESRNSCKDKSPTSKNDLPMTPRKKCGWPPKGVKKGTSAKRSLSRRGRPPKVSQNVGHYHPSLDCPEIAFHLTKYIQIIGFILNLGFCIYNKSIILTFNFKDFF